ncbi:uncharacterized protein LOC116416225 [Nasonia vitripennis]|uniref:Uncharacterized protein n=1 Tax=Nasonia vitripennis TaxID=7425 RepID=A0A7M7Q0Z9_NASVI|nr:uncharacterized protein LOC116416225 [Nasonia vitripennis]
MALTMIYSGINVAIPMSPTGSYVTLLSEDRNNLSTRFVQYWRLDSSVLPGTIRLQDGFEIFVLEKELLAIQNRWIDNVKEMIRKLFKTIIDGSKLKLMTPTGRSNTERIPECVYNAVFQFVNGKVTPENHCGDYRKVITKMCNGLRNPKKHEH